MKLKYQIIKDLPMLLLDIFVPRKCVGCNKEASFICDQCHKDLFQIKIENTLKNTFVPNNKYIDTIYYAFDYGDNIIIQQILKRIKYKFTDILSNIIASASMTHLHNKVPWSEIEYLIPVPLSKKRLKWRGFNQSTLFATAFSDLLICYNIKIPVLNRYLIKYRDTPPQAKYNRKERMHNLENSFKIQNNKTQIIISKNVINMPQIDLPKKICLIDDVCTTGSTLNECAKVLKQAGIEKVFALVIAKKNV